MEKERLKLPYKDVTIEILDFATSDVIATSGTLGNEFSSDDSWT